MTQTTPSTMTCPSGHTFPAEQLTTRDGLAVCPVCDRMPWAPQGPRPWSRALLANPLLLVAFGIVMFLVETISGVVLGTIYANQHIGGSDWLTAGSAVSLVGVALLAVGVWRIIVALRSPAWSRASLSAPLLVLAAGLAVLAIGDVVELGLNIAFVNQSGVGATWQLVGQIFDALFFGAIAGAIAWMGMLARRPDSAGEPGPSAVRA
jgi:hypothetical protein